MAISIIHKPSVSGTTLYSSNSYANSIGSDCEFSETSESKFPLLSVTLYVGANSANNRTMIVIPNYLATVFIPIAIGTTLGTIRCECNGTKFSIVSSSFSSVWVANVTGYRID